MPAPSFRIGYVYRVVFLDHCEGGEEAMTFEVFGRCLRSTRASVTLASWNYVDTLDSPAPIVDDNVTTHNIVRSAILEAIELGPLTD